MQPVQTLTGSQAIQNLLAEAADNIATRGLDLNQPATPALAKVAIGIAARRIHGITDLTLAHREAARAYDRTERVSDSRIARELPCTAVDTQRAADRANRLWQPLVDAAQNLAAAERAWRNDLAAALDAAGDLSGLTVREVITRLYTVAGYLPAPARARYETLRLAVGTPLPNGSTVKAVADPLGSAWAVTDDSGREWRIHKHAELRRFADGDVVIVEPSWSGWSSD